jgi:hypothetical protein
MPVPTSSSGVKAIASVPRLICGFCFKVSIIVMISATPALSSEPSRVVPSAVMMSSPISVFNSGFFATVMICAGSFGNTMSPPW